MLIAQLNQLVMMFYSQLVLSVIYLWHKIIGFDSCQPTFDFSVIYSQLWILHFQKRYSTRLVFSAGPFPEMDTKVLCRFHHPTASRQRSLG